MSKATGKTGGRHPHREILVALAGQPNVGKSTVFNMLTGSHQHIANFPGVTVEKKEGAYRGEDHVVRLVDLPGTYSLTSYTAEERITRDFILLERPEVVVVVVDAANLERNLFLVFQLREMGVPMVVCLNMMDVAARRGLTVNPEALAEQLGVPVVPVTARRGIGREALRQTILETAIDADHGAVPWQEDYGEHLEPVVRDLTDRLAAHEHLIEDFAPRWLAVKLLEADPEVRRLVQHHAHDGSGPDLARAADAARVAFEETWNEAPERLIARHRYRRAAAIGEAVTGRRLALTRTRTDRIDNVVLHPLWGPLALLAALLVFYLVVMTLGSRFQELCLPAVEALRAPLQALFPAGDLVRQGPLESLVVTGLGDGLLTILEFVPLIFVLYLMIGILEDSGYMARVAFLLDRILRRFGLHGQSTLPMILGGVIVGGCAVPGVLATRTMNDERAKLVTILIMPLMNCMAKLPLYLLIVGIFWPAGRTFLFLPQRALVIYGLTLFGFLVALAVARLLSRYVVGGETAPFVLELPAYHLPSPTGVLRRSGQRVWLFVRKIITVVAAVQVVVWFLLHFPGLGFQEDGAYDRQFDALRTAAAAALPEGSIYRPMFRGDAFRRLLEYDARWQEASADVAPDELAKRAREFAAVDPLRFRLANGGRGPDGDLDPAAGRAATAFRDLRDGLARLRHARESQIVRQSYAARFGRLLEPVTRLAGFKWRMNVAIFSGFAAKENLVSTLGTLYSVENPGSETLGRAMAKAEGMWTLRHAIALLFFVALFPPCLPTIVAIRNETGSWRWGLFATIYPVILGFVAAVIAFQVAGLVL